MAHTNPWEVKSPRAHWRLRRVLFNGGEGGWSVAEGQWKNPDEPWEDAIGIRWNGQTGRVKGHPMSTGNPIWFILPDELVDAVRAVTPVQTEAETRKPRGWTAD